MAKLSSRKIGLVHVAATRLHLDDEQYRDLLRQCGGVESAVDLDDMGFNLLMERFEGLGFKSDFSKRHLGGRPGFLSAAQMAFVRSLWDEYTEGLGDDTSLGKWLQRTFQVSALRFLNADLGPKVITALKAMVAKKKAKSASGGDHES